jgi:hypothetical protein
LPRIDQSRNVAKSGVLLKQKRRHAAVGGQAAAGDE